MSYIFEQLYDLASRLPLLLMNIVFIKQNFIDLTSICQFMLRKNVHLGVLRKFEYKIDTMQLKKFIEYFHHYYFKIRDSIKNNIGKRLFFLKSIDRVVCF